MNSILVSLPKSLLAVTRGNGISVILLTLLITSSCIPGLSTSSSKTPSSTYEEDLTAFRPEIEDLDSVKTEDVQQFRVTPENFDSELAVNASLNAKLDTLNRNNAAIRYVNGFAIQVYSGSSSSDAYQARDSILNFMPELKPKVEYDQPIYKVRAGSFIERLELQQTLLQLKAIFPNAISVPSRVKIN